MNKLIVCLAAFLALAGTAGAQKKKKNSKAEDDIIQQLASDTARYTGMFGHDACNCIDSVSKAGNTRAEQMAAITGCIDKQVDAYQMIDLLTKSMTQPGKNKTINININKNSDQYKTYYYEIERWLKDSCAVMNKAIATNDEGSENSFSKNQDALDAYYKGVEYLRAEKFADGIPWFEKAVRTDSIFAFAWDNLGICYRRTAQYEKAEAAYKTSLGLDPAGRTSLQNLPVVYLLQKKDDQAIAAYMEILKHYPGDAEVYYGVAVVYFENKKNMELALDYMCKAYNVYVSEKSPYRSDAEKLINTIYAQMKKDGKEDAFKKILAENNIRTN